MPDLQAHSLTMGQKDGEKWTAAVDLQPTIPKFDRLLGSSMVGKGRCRADHGVAHGAAQGGYAAVVMA